MPLDWRAKIMATLARVGKTLLHETITGTSYEIRREQPGASYPWRFVIMSEPAAAKLAAAKLTAADYGLLFRLVPRMLFEGDGWKPLSQDSLAAEIGCSQSSVSRSLDRLCDAGVIERQNRGGFNRYAEFRVCREFFHVGSAAKWHAMANAEKRSKKAEREKAKADEISEQPDDDGVLPERASD